MRLLWPLPADNTRITSRHGELVLGKPHLGIDISAITGTPVYAAHDGVVRYQWTDAGGNCIKLDSPYIYTRYCHLHSYTADDGERVQAGDEIARSGNTGSATTGAHLHWELHQPDGEALDPLEYIGGALSKLSLQFQQYPEWAKATVARYWTGRWVMALNPPIPDMFPNTKVLGRAMWYPQGYASCDAWESYVLSRGADGGRQYYEYNAGHYAERRNISSTWQFVNEPVIESEQQAANYRDALSVWANLMHGAGLRAVGGVFSRGTPQVRAAVPASNILKIIGPALDKCDALAYHAYSYGPLNLDSAQWTVFRYQLIRDELVALGHKRPKWHISECLLDNAKATRSGYRDEPAYQPDPWAAYLRDLKLFDSIIKADAEVIAAYIFISGAYPQWYSFEVNGAQADELGRYVLSDGGDVVAPPVQPPAPVVSVTQVIGDEMQKHIIPLNPAAALERALAGIGALPASGEFDVTVDGVTYRAQAGRRATERDKQYCAYCQVGDWGNVKTFSRAN
jgi:hypothetical protein